MKTTTVAAQATTDLLGTLRAEEAQKIAERDALANERDAAKKKRDDAEAALLVTGNDQLAGVIKARNEARDLVDVLDVRVARAEVERQRASDRVSDETTLRTRAGVAEEVAAAQAAINETTEGVSAALYQLRDAIAARNTAILAAENVNEKARNYGLPVAVGPATREILNALGDRTDVRVHVGPAVPRFVG